MASITVVLLNCDSAGFADDMPIWRQDFCKRIPIVGVKDTIFQMFDFVVKPFEGFSITTAEHPGHSSPSATIKGFDDP